MLRSRARPTHWSKFVSPTFADLGVSAGVVARLADAGITEPFAIQIDAIPAALAGRDVCGKAPTGSGKTLAFGIPVSERVSQAAPHRPSALILAPTRELASQIMREMKPLLRARNRSVAAVYGGVGFGQQITALRRGVDVLVACPGRLADLVQRRDISLADVKIVVLDEADRMADMGFLPEVKRLLDQTHTERQTLLFSATLDGDVDVLVKRYQHDPVRCEVHAPDDIEEMARVRHEFLDVAREDRVITTAKLVIEHGSAVVFSRTKHGADRIARQLNSAGVSSVAIHGNRSQGQRDRALASFASGEAQALVATDVAARGIHVDDVGCVVHFDLPPETKDYVHRSGRTGRAGAGGVVISLVTPDDRAVALKIQREIGLIETPAPPARQARPAGNGGGGNRRGGRSGRPRRRG
jgi:superfamily II DNA/RNA helicase